MGVGGGNGRSPIGKEKKNGYKKEGGRRGGEYSGGAGTEGELMRKEKNEKGGNRGRGREKRWYFGSYEKNKNNKMK